MYTRDGLAPYTKDKTVENEEFLMKYTNDLFKPEIQRFKIFFKLIEEVLNQDWWAKVD